MRCETDDPGTKSTGGSVWHAEHNGASLLLAHRGVPVEFIPGAPADFRPVNTKQLRIVTCGCLRLCGSERGVWCSNDAGGARCGETVTVRLAIQRSPKRLCCLAMTIGRNLRRSHRGLQMKALDKFSDRLTTLTASRPCKHPDRPASWDHRPPHSRTVFLATAIVLPHCDMIPLLPWRNRGAWAPWTTLYPAQTPPPSRRPIHARTVACAGGLRIKPYAAAGSNPPSSPPPLLSVAVGATFLQDTDACKRVRMRFAKNLAPELRHPCGPSQPHRTSLGQVFASVVLEDAPWEQCLTKQNDAGQGVVAFKP
jgi:hypothetical protein